MIDTPIGRLIEAELGCPTCGQKRRPSLTKTIIAQFGDGQWHSVADIAAAVAGGDEDHVITTLKRMLQAATIGGVAERRAYGKSFQYRIFRDARSKSVPAEEIRTKLGPLLMRLRDEGKKNLATMSPPTVAEIAFKLTQQVREWTASSPASPGPKRRDAPQDPERSA